ncbi:hypothetical protein UPYG_G00007590 [Umbra pygmaea]|uniref:Coiled-coil domain-containing protein n=1 Tax=Umbra pygmaea TaxID=75934 RepID=A0ABD0XKA8_UMBPY
MTELEIDKSHLPRVQDVCHVFAVLEDGALAHNLQEQEIEQYYTTNIQKNQLVQKDIRIAKRLQEEEEEQRGEHRALLSQASRQLEEQDSEYAQMIQQEIQRCAEEEARRREHEDQEMAKRIQEEEERASQMSSGQETNSADCGSIPASPTSRPHQPALLPASPTSPTHQPAVSTSPSQGVLQCQSATSRWQYSPTNSHAQATAETMSESYMTAGQNNRCLSSRNSPPRRLRNDLQPPPYDWASGGDADAVFLEHLPPSLPCRLEKRLTAPPGGRVAPVHHPQERSRRHGSFREVGGREEEARLRSQQGRGSQGSRAGVWDRNRRVDAGHEREASSEVWRGRRYSSGTCEAPQSMQNREPIRRSWTYRETSDNKQVRFQDDASRRCRSHHGDRRRPVNVWELIAHDLKERGMTVEQPFYRGSLSPGRGSVGEVQVHAGGSAVVDSHGESIHQMAFQRAVSSRRSYHGDVRARSRASQSSAHSGRGHVVGERPTAENLSMDAKGLGLYEDTGLRSGGGQLGSRGHRRHHSERRARRRERTQEEQTSSEEEARERRGERPPPPRRVPQRSQSFCSRDASVRARPWHAPRAGPLLQTEDGACLDLAELEQVLKDEELARRLQEEEDRLLRTSPPAHPRSTLRVSVPDGDFRLAQVAQDEEIAHFIQKQEIKSKHQSHDLDRPDSWREQHDLADPHERRNARERQVVSSCQMRERLDSEGLQSPTDDQSPSPTTLPQQSIRNIVEDLDPTFKARRQVKDSLRVGPTISGLSSCQSLPTPDSVLHVSMEEPTFVPPTKRQTEKSGHTKSKEKRENWALQFKW